MQKEKIYLRLSIDGVRMEMLQRNSYLKQWIPGSGRIDSKNEEARACKAYLTEIPSLRDFQGFDH